MLHRKHAISAGLVAGLSAFVLVACATGSPPAEPDALRERALVYFEPLPDAAPSPDNPITEAKVALGRRLYHDPQLSRLGNVSCNSCHDVATYGVDNLPVSPGDGGQLGARNSPSVFNAALHVAQFWDGRAADVEEQAGMPVLNPVEMAIPGEAFLLDRLAGTPEYPEAFAAAFPGEHPALTYANIGRALGAFERTLLTPSRFDAWLAGDRNAVLTAEERAGLERFLDLSCTSCHNGSTVGARFFRKFGLNEPYWTRTGSAAPDEGRYVQTGDPEDRYVFKVASLRNVAETGPYFHDGSVAGLREAVEVMAELQVGTPLSDTEVDPLVAFLRTLTGEVPTAARRTSG
jgi:cytochrome c peroxidase